MTSDCYHDRSLCLQAFVRGESLNAGGVIKMLARQSVGGPAIGVAFAVCLAGWLRWVPQEAPAAAGAALTAAFAAFFVAEQILLTSGEPCRSHTPAQSHSDFVGDEQGMWYRDRLFRFKRCSHARRPVCE